MAEYVLFRRVHVHYKTDFVGCLRKNGSEDETTAENFEELISDCISKGYRLSFGDNVTTIPRRVRSVDRHIDEPVNEALLETFEKLFKERQTLKPNERTDLVS